MLKLNLNLLSYGVLIKDVEGIRQYISHHNNGTHKLLFMLMHAYVFIIEEFRYNSTDCHFGMVNVACYKKYILMIAWNEGKTIRPSVRLSQIYLAVEPTGLWVVTTYRSREIESHDHKSRSRSEVMLG